MATLSQPAPLPPGFLDFICVQPQADGTNWLLARTLEYRDGQGTIRTTPAGFVTDFASIPPLSTLAGIVLCLVLPLFGWGCWKHLLWLIWACLPFLLFGLFVVLIAYSLNCDVRLDGPATQHDYGYRVKREQEHYETAMWSVRGKLAADFLFLEAMKASGVGRWKRWVVFFNVFAFGWGAYHNDARLAR